jgi:hypothetical protein
MSGPNIYAIGARHCTAFGAIIQGFARCEYLMAIIVSTLTNTDVFRTFALMIDLGYAGKRNTTRAIIDLSELPPEQKERLKWFLGEIHKHNQLRNCIAHLAWTVGTRPDSVKPYGATTRRGKLEVTGMSEDDGDFLVSELEFAANELADTYNKLTDYLIEIGIMSNMRE